MIILHAAPVKWGRLAGLSASVPGLVAAQNALPDVEAALLTTVSRDAWRCDSFPVFGSAAICRRTGRPDLPAPFDRPDLVVFHSTYIPLHARLARYLRQAAIPYLICPRGGMTRYSHAGKRWKKTAANLLFFNRVVRGAKALQFLTPGEAEASAAWKAPFFVLGNGVDLPEFQSTDVAGQRQGTSHAAFSVETNAGESGLQLQPIGKCRPRRIVFMGRLHIDHKGLDMLLHACALIARELAQAGIVVEIFGPDCGGSAKQLAAQIARDRTQEVVALRGPTSGADKMELLATTDVFVHPSRTEGQPMAVLEALAHGVPCLLTPNTNMAEAVEKAAAGWRIDASVEGIAQGLRSVIRLPGDVLSQAARNARSLAEKSFSWQEIARRSVAEYRRFAA
ncbi:MAG: glycosyltransferase [Planctomycetaceae bacterium]|nr:glycosyltransferase [Planctomycetaceae bacterium]